MTAAALASDSLQMVTVDYAARGWPVVPLHWPTSFGPKTGPDRARCSCRRDDCQSQGKHPLTPNGLVNATTDRAVICEWWRRWPNANVGLLTGVAFDVVDLDGDHALDELDSAAPVAADVIDGPISCTGNGAHLFVQPTGCGNRARVLPGVDWRGVRGYVVAPPSLHYLGAPYAWGVAHGPDRPIPPCPPWLVDLVRGRPRDRVRELAAGLPQQRRGQVHGYGDTALKAECGAVALAVEGDRNDTLNRAAHNLGQLVAGEVLDVGDVVRHLLVAASRCGLGQTEAENTIASGLKAGARSPRRAPR